MTRRRGLFLTVCFLLLLPDTPLRAQDEPPAQQEGQTVRLYMDCNAMGCFDLDFLRREIPFVNWVRDIRDGDVYLLITQQQTGAGGSSSELVFQGQGRFEGMADTLAYVALPNSTTDSQRRGLAGIMKIGLMRYVGLTDLAGDIEIGLGRPAGPGPGGPGGPLPPGGPTAPEDDPWDFWSFTVRGSGSLSGQSDYSSNRFSGSVSANRTTDDWKVEMYLSHSYSEQKYDYDEYTQTSIRRDYHFSGLLGKSLADQWSVGLRAEAQNSTYFNYDFYGVVSPVIEYSFFPYSESARKSLVLEYGVNANYADYREETIFEETEESFVTQSLSLGLNFTQPWGNAYTLLSAANHLEDFGVHHATLYGGLSLRLSRGLRLTLSGSASRVRDRINVALGAADTQEEILLRRQLFQTDYTYSTSISLSYQFGSIFNNIVNPRLEGGMGSGVMIMM